MVFFALYGLKKPMKSCNEDDFNKLDMSIRGEVPDGYFKQITLTFNPWSATSWLKPRFFDVEDDEHLHKNNNLEAK